MANFTLYELTEEARELQDMIEEYPPETFSDTIESLQLMIEDKADSYAAVNQNITNEIAALKAEEERLSARRKSLESNQKRLKDAIKNAMEILGQNKIKTEKFTFSVSKNGGSQPIEVDAELLPDNYKKVIVEPDKELIRKAIESGIDIPGVKVLERGTHLTIK
jgi:predicted transcriptional regulator